MNIPFVGPTYGGLSSSIDASRSVNLYPETNAPGAKEPMALVGAPGTRLWASLGALPVRGMHVLNGLLYVVAGGNLYGVAAAGVVSPALGLLSTGSGRVLMADNGTGSTGAGGNQLMIADGTAGYVYNAATGVFGKVAGGGFPAAGAGSLTYIDGYFIAAAPGSMTVSASNLYDGTTWNGLAASPVDPRVVVRCACAGRSPRSAANVLPPRSCDRACAVPAPPRPRPRRANPRTRKTRAPGGASRRGRAKRYCARDFSRIADHD